MVKEQVKIVIFVVYGDPLLSGKEGEVGPQLQDEAFEFPQDGLLGWGWTHTYNMTATESISESAVYVTYGDGRQDLDRAQALALERLRTITIADLADDGRAS